MIEKIISIYPANLSERVTGILVYDIATGRKYSENNFICDSIGTFSESDAKKYINSIKTRNTTTVGIIPDDAIFSRKVSLPKFPEDKLEQIVKYEINQTIPRPLSQVLIGYEMKQADEEVDIVMAAMRRDLIQGTPISNADVIRPAFDVVSRLYKNRLANLNGVTSLLNLDEKNADFIVFENGGYQYSRVIRLADTNGQKIDANRFAGELKLTIGYYRSLRGSREISRIITTSSDDFTSNLTNIMGIPVEYQEPYVETDFRKPKDYTNKFIQAAAGLILTDDGVKFKKLRKR